jgi:aminoacyl tRNA synthase complex-interacting multifunctional protein 1
MAVCQFRHGPPIHQHGFASGYRFVSSYLQQSNDQLAKDLGVPEDPVQAALFRQYLTLSSRFPGEAEQLNEALKPRTYLLDTEEPSRLDAVVLSRVIQELKKWDNDKIVGLRHIVRWADLVQNKLDIAEGDKLKLNVDLEAPREVKAKAKKAGDKKTEVKEADAVAAPTAAAASTGAEVTEGQAKEKKEKKEKKKKEKKPQPVKEEIPINPGMIDLRVGFIEKAIKHPDADSLYVSTIHMGDEEGPRTVCSGLVKYYPLEAMQKRRVIVVANLKPVSMRGIKSSAMVLCASHETEGGESTVEFVNPPEGAEPGDKVFFESYDSVPEKQLNPKKKIWETVQPGFSTNESLEVIYKKEGEPDRRLVTKSGQVCKVPTLVNATVR